MHLIFRTALMLCTMLVFVAQALAADVRSYAVLPFKVNGSSGFTYLENAIPSMPVSYTHLDVYKRQPIHAPVSWCSPASSIRTSPIWCFSPGR